MGETSLSPDRTLIDLVHGLHGAVALVDRDMHILELNAECERDIRTPRAEALGRNYFELVPAALQWQAIFARCLAGETVKTDRVRLKNRRGEPVWIQSSNIPWHDHTGAVGGIVITTQRLSAGDVVDEQARATARLEDAVTIAGIHVWEMNYETQQLWAAGAADTFFEGTASYDKLAGDRLSAVHPDDRERVDATWREQAVTGGLRDAEYRLNRDKLVWVSARARTLRGPDGEAQRVLGVLQDITDRKLAELRADEANAAKSAFLATMSHEIRTPLNGVLGMAQAMAAGELSDEQRGRLDVVRQSGEALLTILNDILDLSKIEAGKLELETLDFDLGEVVRSVHAPFSAIADDKGVALRLDIEPATGLYRGDPTRLRQILYNLTSNALKFTAAGEVALTARLEPQGLELRVADTGIGIAADRLAALFESFTQADAATSRKFGGTGLGLSICRRLAELMGGTIRAESVLGEGATFIVTLPLPRIGEAAAEAPPPESPAEPQALGALRVLAAEDNAVNRLVLRTLLEQIGIEPEVVDDGVKAVAAWEGQSWDLILMDVQMPEMDGPSATRAIREREAATGRPRTPIIALTANAMSHQIAEYLAAGMDGHVSKPIEAARLFEAIAAVADSLAEAPAGAADVSRAS